MSVQVLKLRLPPLSIVVEVERVRHKRGAEVGATSASGRAQKNDLPCRPSSAVAIEPGLIKLQI